MLPADRRLVDGASFGQAVRRGRRAGSRTLVVHLHLLEPPHGVPDAHREPSLARVGLVVSRAVGNAVVRNRVKRRLRHLVADRLDLLPEGADLVVRALPAAAGAGQELASDLDRCLQRVVSR